MHKKTTNQIKRFLNSFSFLFVFFWNSFFLAFSLCHPTPWFIYLFTFLFHLCVFVLSSSVLNTLSDICFQPISQWVLLWFSLCNCCLLKSVKLILKLKASSIFLMQHESSAMGCIKCPLSECSLNLDLPSYAFFFSSRFNAA